MADRVEIPPDFEMGPKFSACSAQERLFVWAVAIDDMDATNAARAAGYTDTGTGAIRVRGHALMHRDRVQEALLELGKKVFQAQLPLALKANRSLLENEKHPDHHKAVQTTLSRFKDFAERVGLDVTHGGEVTVSHTDAALDALRMMRQLEVPRAKLLEHFGHSGLPRYERMLDELEGRPAVKVIEHAKD